MRASPAAARSLEPGENLTARTGLTRPGSECSSRVVAVEKMYMLPDECPEAAKRPSGDYHRSSAEHYSPQEVEKRKQCTKSTLSPKLPLVSYSRILSFPANKSHTLMRPSCVVPAKYCPSNDKHTAHNSPAFFGASLISLSNFHTPSLQIQTLASPANPTLTARSPASLTAMWWQPSRWAFSRVCWREYSSEAVVE